MKQEQPQSTSARVLVVNEPEAPWQPISLDPLEEELRALKLSQPLMKELNFTSNVNKLDHFQELLRKNHTHFIKKVNLIASNHRQLLNKTKAIFLTVQSKEFIQLPFNEGKFSSQMQQLLRLKTDADKYHKLSTAMINILKSMETKLQN